MKHVFLFGTFFLLFYSGFSQARIGWTEQQIKTEFYNSTFETDYLDNGNKYIASDNGFAKTAYVFNELGLCYITMVIPNSQAAVNFFVESYNNKYVIVSETEWKAYLENGILDIKLFFDDDGPYFLIQ